MGMNLTLSYDIIISPHNLLYQVGSLIYQLLHYKHGDASDMVHSLDVPWLYLFRPSIMFQATEEDLSTVKCSSRFFQYF